MNNKTYRLADVPTIQEFQQNGVSYPLGENPLVARDRLAAVRTGEFREPKAGEWYISGAIPWAYKSGGFSKGSKYHIAKLIKRIS